MNKGRVEQMGAPEEVYNHPATPFVFGFLGNVNLFHGRVHEGLLDTGDASFAAPDHAQARDASGVGFVRPHDLDIDRYAPGAEGIVVHLRRSQAIGPLTQLELERPGSVDPIEAVIPNERFAQMHLQVGEPLVIKPRRLKVFIDQSQSREKT